MNRIWDEIERWCSRPGDIDAYTIRPRDEHYRGNIPGPRVSFCGCGEQMVDGVCAGIVTIGICPGWATGQTLKPDDAVTE